MNHWKITVELNLSDFGDPREWIVRVLNGNLKVGETIEYLDTERQLNLPLIAPSASGDPQARKVNNSLDKSTPDGTLVS